MLHYNSLTKALGVLPWRYHRLPSVLQLLGVVEALASQIGYIQAAVTCQDTEVGFSTISMAGLISLSY